MEVYRSTLSRAIRYPSALAAFHRRIILASHVTKVFTGVGKHTRGMSSTSGPSQIGGHVMWIKGALNVWITPINTLNN